MLLQVIFEVSCTVFHHIIDWFSFWTKRKNYSLIRRAAGRTNIVVTVSVSNHQPVAMVTYDAHSVVGIYRL